VVDGSPDDGDVEYAEAKRGGELAVIGTFGDRGRAPQRPDRPEVGLSADKEAAFLSRIGLP